MIIIIIIIGGTPNRELSCRCSLCEIRQPRHSTDWAITKSVVVFRYHDSATNIFFDVWNSFFDLFQLFFDLTPFRFHFYIRCE